MVPCRICMKPQITPSQYLWPVACLMVSPSPMSYSELPQLFAFLVYTPWRDSHSWRCPGPVSKYCTVSIRALCCLSHFQVSPHVLTSLHFTSLFLSLVDRLEITSPALQCVPAGRWPNVKRCSIDHVPSCLSLEQLCTSTWHAYVCHRLCSVWCWAKHTDIGFLLPLNSWSSWTCLLAYDLWWRRCVVDLWICNSES
jgi:hypothetical protein